MRAFDDDERLRRRLRDLESKMTTATNHDFYLKILLSFILLISTMMHAERASGQRGKSFGLCILFQVLGVGWHVLTWYQHFDQENPASIVIYIIVAICKFVAHAD